MASKLHKHLLRCQLMVTWKGALLHHLANAKPRRHSSAEIDFSELEVLSKACHIGLPITSSVSGERQL